MLPRELSDQRKSRAGGAYYTFAQKLYGSFNGADLRLENHSFITGGGGANLGLMTNLGDLSLDDISVDTTDVSYLSQYIAPKKEKAAHSEHARFQSGYSVGKQLYKSSLPVVLNNTYVVRSIRYKKFDSLVAFRIVQQDAL